MAVAGMQEALYDTLYKTEIEASGRAVEEGGRLCTDLCRALQR